MPDVLDVLRASAGDPTQPALVDLRSGGRWTYAELDRVVDERALRIQGEGAAGDVRAVSVGADQTGVVEALATWRAGRVLAPMNPSLTDAERHELAAGLGGLSVPTGAQAVIWTSGTSGTARGVVLGSDGLRAITVGSVERLGVGSDDVWGLTLSPAHVGGLAALFRAVLLGGTLVCPSDRSARALHEMLAGAAGEVPTRLSLVPTQLLKLVERGARPSDALRSVLVGGAHAPESLVRRCTADGWPIALTYGATETTSQMATATPEETRADPTHVGRPMAGVELRVGADGEVLARGRTLALGRIGSSTLEPVTAPDGWLHTGDTGTIDADGYVRVSGRRIDRIVSGGVTVEAVEVEEFLREIVGVRDACVVGLADEEWGDKVAAWVDLEESADPEGIRARLESAAREGLSAAKRPRVWLFGGVLPRNANGKVDRAAVRAAIETGHRS